MCGIAGFYGFGGGSADELRSGVESMSACLRHRGPDDSAIWLDASAGIGLGFRRLAIVDLSPAGAQPMHSASGRFVIIFNGEIYNYARIREQLPPQAWRGHSDTEVVLAAIEAWGLRPALQHFIGMFAFALWDKAERTLTLVRDRAGVKPLYYAHSAAALLFGSELRAIESSRHFQRDIDRGAVALYARYGFIPAPWSIWKGVRKLRPGSLLTIDSGGRAIESTWWNAAEVAERAAANPFRGNDEEAIEELDRLLRDSVGLRMIADVPLGVFLSGGIDSSCVTALMQQQSSAPVKTFTIGMRGSPLDEAEDAGAAARHLGTRHTEHHLTAREVLDVFPNVGTIYDEPFADSSGVPTYLVSKLARRDVTVALSGDGGDELFGGYHSYFLGERMYRHVDRVPRSLRRISGTALSLVKGIDPRIDSVANALRLDDVIAVHESGLAYPGRLLSGGTRPPIALTSRDWPRVNSRAELRMFADFGTYLPDDILVKVDRATMAVSLEGREPLLDHRVIELAWSLPVSMKLREGGGKWILKAVLRRYLPPALFDREKKGFGIPLGQWLRGDLRDWAESLLACRSDYFLDDEVARLWREHLRGDDHSGILWRVLMFDAWSSRHR